VSPCVVRPGGERPRAAVRRTEGRPPDPAHGGDAGGGATARAGPGGLLPQGRPRTRGRGPPRHARKLKAMGHVPVEIVERIATLAKLNIVAVDLVE
jgi:hypothetical protein